MAPLASYTALRVCETSQAPRWWAAVKRSRDSAPPAVRAVLAGRMRIELTHDDALAVIRWAAQIEGWPAEGPTPLWIYPPAPDAAS
jgi:hypothetical protein